VAAATIAIVITHGAAQAKAANASMTPTDQTFILSANSIVRYAIPASVLVRASTSRAQIRTVCVAILQQDERLARLHKEAAANLNAALRQTPTADEQAALDRVSTYSGNALDTTYVRDVWASDSTLLPLAAEARVATRNSLVRSLSQEALEVIGSQLRLLESTGLVDHAEPTPAAPSPTSTRPAKLRPSVDPALVEAARNGTVRLSPSEPVTTGVLGVAVAIILVISLRHLRMKNRRNNSNRRYRSRQ
jgi:hypothetical protein